jgi:hypothetical protein
VVDEIGGDQLIAGGQVPLAPHLLVETALRRLGLLGRHGGTSWATNETVCTPFSTILRLTTRQQPSGRRLLNDPSRREPGPNTERGAGGGPLAPPQEASREAARPQPTAGRRPLDGRAPPAYAWSKTS